MKVFCKTLGHREQSSTGEPESALYECISLDTGAVVDTGTVEFRIVRTVCARCGERLSTTLELLGNVTVPARTATRLVRAGYAQELRQDLETRKN